MTSRSYGNYQQQNTSERPGYDVWFLWQSPTPGCQEHLGMTSGPYGNYQHQKTSEGPGYDLILVPMAIKLPTPKDVRRPGPSPEGYDAGSP